VIIMSKCPVCRKYFPKKAQVLEHIDDKHSDLIPETWSTARFFYAQNHGGRDYGLCRICKQPTRFVDKAGKPRMLCEMPECRKAMSDIADANNIKMFGKPHRLDEPDFQNKMLANRSISGEYAWSDGKTRKSYVGSYEAKLLKYADLVLDIDPELIYTPCPFTFEYTDETGVDRFWIPDQYWEAFNLIIEVKDGGDNPNMHHKIVEVDKSKERMKDKVLLHQNKFNYIKITNNDFRPLVELLFKIKMRNLEPATNNIETFKVIQESVGSDLTEYLDISDLYVVLYGPFKDIIEGVGISFNPVLDVIYTFDNASVRTHSKSDTFFKNRCATIMKYNGEDQTIIRPILDKLMGDIGVTSLNNSSFSYFKNLLIDFGFSGLDYELSSAYNFIICNELSKIATIDNLNKYDFFGAVKGMNLYESFIPDLLLETSTPIDSKESAYVKAKFPNAQCSFAKNKDGKYYCHTHRARSPFYDTIEEIPKSRVDFVSSTS
jgi:hypothetical protein